MFVHSLARQHPSQLATRTVPINLGPWDSLINCAHARTCRAVERTPISPYPSLLRHQETQRHVCLRSKLRDGPTVPALGSGRERRWQMWALCRPIPHLPLPTQPLCGGGGGSRHQEVFQILPFTGAEQTALPLLNGLQSSVGKSLIGTQRKSIAA